MDKYVKRNEVLNFIRDNCTSIEEYVDNLNRKGVVGILSAFGIDINYACKLDLKAFRIILCTVLNYQFNLRNRE